PYAGLQASCGGARALALALVCAARPWNADPTRSANVAAARVGACAAQDAILALASGADRAEALPVTRASCARRRRGVTLPAVAPVTRGAVLVGGAGAAAHVCVAARICGW